MRVRAFPGRSGVAVLPQDMIAHQTVQLSIVWRVLQSFSSPFHRQAGIKGIKPFRITILQSQEPLSICHIGGCSPLHIFHSRLDIPLCPATIQIAFPQRHVCPLNLSIRSAVPELECLGQITGECAILA